MDGTALVRGEWQLLAREVERFQPNIVVLIARKAPRIWQRLALRLAGNPLVISDLAIPFSSRYLKGARVAVVDDVVNVGTTMQRATRLCEKLGARDVRAFAVARLMPPSAGAAANVVATYVSGELDHKGLQAFGARVPDALQGLARPYDVDFPVLECSLAFPYRDFEDLQAELVRRFDASRVYDLTTRAGAAAGVRRVVIDFAPRAGAHLKVRCFFDETSGRCVVVPICVPPVMDHAAPDPADRLATAVWHHLTQVVPQDDHEPRARLRLFLNSLTFGRTLLEEHADLLTPPEHEPFSMRDAEIIFGPRIRRAVTATELRADDGLEHEPPVARADGALDPSPFLATTLDADLLRDVRRRAKSDDPLSVFIALFEELADAVGANDPGARRFNGLYREEELAGDPYLRLRIGPTVNDTIAIVHQITGRDVSLETTRRRVTRLFDRFIDAGAVVPTTATFDGRVYRIYRKGEGDFRLEAMDRLLNAWRSYERPLSLTRATKIAAILEFSEPGDSAVAVKAEERGNTYAFRSTLLDDETEVVHYLRNTGRIRRVSDSERAPDK